MPAGRRRRRRHRRGGESRSRPDEADRDGARPGGARGPALALPAQADPGPSSASGRPPPHPPRRDTRILVHPTFAAAARIPGAASARTGAGAGIGRAPATTPAAHAFVAPPNTDFDLRFTRTSARRSEPCSGPRPACGPRSSRWRCPSTSTSASRRSPTPGSSAVPPPPACSPTTNSFPLVDTWYVPAAGQPVHGFRSRSRPSRDRRRRLGRLRLLRGCRRPGAAGQDLAADPGAARTRSRPRPHDAGPHVPQRHRDDPHGWPAAGLRHPDRRPPPRSAHRALTRRARFGADRSPRVGRRCRGGRGRWTAARDLRPQPVRDRELGEPHRRGHLRRRR